MRLGPRTVVDLLRRERLLTLTPTGKARSLVEEIVGGPVKGSWWGHPKGKLIYACSVALEESGEAVAVKLLAGKVTFVHRALWPALYRLATDEARRRAAIAELDAPARALLARVEKEGELRLDRVEKAREALEKALLVVTEDVHTEKGSHAKVLRSWARWAPDGIEREAAGLGYKEARCVLGLS